MRKKLRAQTVSAPEPMRSLFTATLRGFMRHDGLTQSAALAFFFLMSLFPFLIFIFSAVALLPIQDLPQRTYSLLSSLVPGQSIALVRSILDTTVHTNRGLLSAGFIGAIIFASNAFAVTIAALDRAYDVEETRSFWQVRLLAIGMTFVVGGLIAFGLIAMLVGPHFGMLFADEFGVTDLFAVLWPYARWALIFTCAVTSISLLYHWGPNASLAWRKQLPGALLAALLWGLSSAILGIYIREFGFFHTTYGALGAFIALMVRFQLSALAILLGAELNVQLFRREVAATILAARARADAEKKKKALVHTA